ncbi:MAG: lytic murein transglycosylase [Solirubrobacteraceae bacterium]
MLAVLALTGAVLAALFMAAVPRASADPCVVTVTLVGGQTLRFNVDVPAGTSVSSLNLPIVGAVLSKTMTCTLATSSSSTTTTTTTTTTTPTTSATTTGSSSSSSSSSSTTSSSSSTSTSTSTSPSHSHKPPTTPTTPTAPTTSKAPSSQTPEKSSRHGTTSHPSSSKQHHRAKKPDKRKRVSSKKPALPSGKGVPSSKNPTYSLSLPGPAPIGVPNFFIDSFQIPPFLIPIYQAAGIEYQVPWQVLAAINEIETDYGRNLSVSSAGAVGWMQFLPSTFKEWGVDANGDGIADPYNPVDAIFTAARYLHAAGASQNLSQAIFAYNHAGWYVQSVLLRAKLIGGIPSQLIGALTGLVQGHFPVAAPAKYADDSVVSLAKHKVKGSNAAIPIGSDLASKGTSIFAKRGSPVIAVNDGKIVKVGESTALGHYIKLQDSTGNTYTYAHLGSVSKTYPVAKPVKITARDIAHELAAPKVKAPKTAASAGQQATTPTPAAPATRAPKQVTASATAGKQVTAPAAKAPKPAASSSTASISAPLVKERLFAHPSRTASYAAGGNLQLKHTSQQVSSFQNYFSDVLHLGKKQYTLKRLKAGSIVIAGTILGHIGGPTQGLSPHLYFTIQPAGRNAPNIDPKPILDGWKLLEATAVYRAANVDPFYGPGAKNPTVGQVLLMSKQQLTERVLTDPHVQIYNCGRRDIQTGQIDRRVLATIEFLSASGLDPYVSGLKCGASINATTGTDAQGATGQSVDISKINGVPVLGHQGAGSTTDLAIRRLLTLQGAMKPDEIVSDIAYKSQPNTLALPDHKNRIQITFTPDYGTNKKLSSQIKSILQPGQWAQLINRISQIPEPVVPISPSKYAIRKPKN